MRRLLRALRNAAPIGAMPVASPGRRAGRCLGVAGVVLALSLASACQRIDTLEGDVAALRQAEQERSLQLAAAQARLATTERELEALRQVEQERASELAEAQADLAELRREVEALRQAERDTTEQVARLQAQQAETEAYPADEVYEAMPEAVGAAAESDAPDFPWPPPRASASVVIPATFIRSSGIADPRLGDVAERLRAALDEGGYFDRSYYAAPGGFAMVTRLERIDADGTPRQPGRWSVEAQPLQSFSLGAYLRALFTAPTGYYRIIVFVVSSQPFAQSAEEVSQGEALAWLHEGLNRLPASIADAPYTDRHAVTALIYQFERPGRREPLLVLQGSPSGREHLERAQLWGALSP